MIHKVRSLQRTKAQLRRNGAVEPPPAPDFPTYWQARYPKYEYAPHVEILASKLSALRPGDALVINMPPRHGKSETVKAYLEWMLGKDPSTGVMFASYSGALANQASRQIRNEVQSGHAFTQHFPHVQLAPDAKKVQQWRLREGGGLIASGVGGSLTGMGARIGVIDDPLKGSAASRIPENPRRLRRLVSERTSLPGSSRAASSSSSKRAGTRATSRAGSRRTSSRATSVTSTGTF